MNNSSGLYRLIPVGIGLLVMLFMAAKGCQEGPFGRRQLIQLNPQEEAQLGAQAYQKVLAESRVVERGPAVDAVKEVGRRLALASTDPRFLERFKLRLDRHFDWEFRLLQSPEINAFCLPGGKVAVYTGILPVCETEAGLAVVMGHEIGHALARHGAERMAQAQLVQVGQIAVATSLGGMDPYQQQQIMGLLGLGAQYGVLLPFSRKHESEADHIGVLLMATAGYDPREAPKFWIRMAKATSSRGQPPQFQSTHPSHETRIHDLQNWVETEALALYEGSEHAPNRPLPSASALSARPPPPPLREPVKSGMKGKGYEFK
jgi:metalloendopeptidase OMA1, mitochondrial